SAAASLQNPIWCCARPSQCPGSGRVDVEGESGTRALGSPCPTPGGARRSRPPAISSWRPAMSVNTPARRANPSRGRPRRRNTGRDQRHAAAAARAAQVKAFDTTTSQFGSYGLPDVLVASLGVDGIVEPTPVQAAVLPDALA